jgi:hypothetical protein
MRDSNKGTKVRVLRRLRALLKQSGRSRTPHLPLEAGEWRLYAKEPEDNA